MWYNEVMTIELSEVNKSYGKKLVLEDVNLVIPTGAFVMLNGSSGSGKSTLLNMIGGIESVTSGEIVIDGKSVQKMPAKERVNFYRHQVGFIFQGFYLQPQLTVAENIALTGIFAGMPKAERQQRVQELAENLGIANVLEQKPAEISGGQAERACAARAMFMRPQIILADEPTNNLDPENARNVIEMLKKIWQDTGATVIVASHDVMVEAYATMVVRVSNKKVMVVPGVEEKAEAVELAVETVENTQWA